MPDEVLSKMTRSGGSADDAPSNDGIGLALAETVIHARGGTLTLCNLSPGFRVTIHLPAHVSRRPRASPA